MKTMQWVAAVALGLTTLLGGCGGGGGSAGTPPFGGGTDTTGTGTTGVASNTSGSVVLGLPASVISSSAPGTVTALVKDASGAAIANTIVTFAVSSAIATANPLTVLTDASGSASTTIIPASASSVGAAYISASADSTAGTLTTKVAFSVSAVNVTLNSLTPASASINAYASTVLNISVTGASSASPVTVALSSTCASATPAKATISPASITLTSGTGQVTYQDNGCSTTDRINASIVGTSQQLTADLGVQPPAGQAIQFVSSNPTVICLAGSGCPPTSTVTFKVIDQFGNAVANKAVDFALDIPGVADISPTTQTTKADGTVSVSVASKTVPSPVRVSASVTGTSLSTVSNTLAINAGLPTQNGVSFSAAAYNIDGLEKDGTSSAIRLQLNDRFGNPVPDGTSISLVSEGASIIPASCVTSNAVCTVNFVSSNYRPPNGRIAVTAYAQGEESFADANGNNLYDLGESFGDLGTVYLDKNENGVQDIGEYIAGSAPNGIWDGNTFVRAQRLFVLSSSAAAPRLFDASIDSSGKRVCSSTALPSVSLTLVPGSVCRAQKLICVRDSNAAADPLGGNPIPVGAALSITTKAKGATILVDGSPITGLVTSPTFHVVQADLSDCTTADTPGAIDLSIQMPNSGPTYTFPIGQVN